MGSVVNPIDFIAQLIDPATGRPFILYPEEVTFVREAFTLTPEGRLPYSDAVFAGPKKSGKTALGGMCELYVTLATGEKDAEGYALANSLDQATGRVFQAISRIVRATPALKKMARILENRIEFETGVIAAVPATYAGQAGSNPCIACFDELWAYTGEAGTRLFEEMSPSPVAPKLSPVEVLLTPNGLRLGRLRHGQVCIRFGRSTPVTRASTSTRSGRPAGQRIELAIRSALEEVPGSPAGVGIEAQLGQHPGACLGLVRAR